MQTPRPHYIDTHFHLLSMAKKGIDPKTMLSQMEGLGMEGIDIGTDADDLTERATLVKDFPFVRLSAGIGPWQVAEGNPPMQELLSTLRQQLEQQKVVAIGEIGLDNHWNYGTRDLQEALLIEQIQLANQMHKPVIFHNREADEQFMQILQTQNFVVPGIFHCYQGSEELASLAVEKGFLISFAGPLTYPANKSMQQLLKKLPLQSLLLETDSPYLSPNPVRGKPNSPLNMQHIYRFAATLLSVEEKVLMEQIEQNFHRFLTA